MESEMAFELHGRQPQHQQHVVDGRQPYLHAGDYDGFHYVNDAPSWRPVQPPLHHQQGHPSMHYPATPYNVEDQYGNSPPGYSVPAPSCLPMSNPPLYYHAQYYPTQQLGPPVDVHPPLPVPAMYPIMVQFPAADASPTSSSDSSPPWSNYYYTPRQSQSPPASLLQCAVVGQEPGYLTPPIVNLLPSAAGGGALDSNRSRYEADQQYHHQQHQQQAAVPSFNPELQLTTGIMREGSGGRHSPILLLGGAGPEYSIGNALESNSPTAYSNLPSNAHYQQQQAYYTTTTSSQVVHPVVGFPTEPVSSSSISTAMMIGEAHLQQQQQQFAAVGPAIGSPPANGAIVQMVYATDSNGAIASGTDALPPSTIPAGPQQQQQQQQQQQVPVMALPPFTSLTQVVARRDGPTHKVRKRLPMNSMPSNGEDGYPNQFYELPQRHIPPRGYLPHGAQQSYVPYDVSYTAASSNYSSSNSPLSPTTPEQAYAHPLLNAVGATATPYPALSGETEYQPRLGSSSSFRMPRILRPDERQQHSSPSLQNFRLPEYGTPKPNPLGHGLPPSPSPTQQRASMPSSPAHGATSKVEKLSPPVKMERISPPVPATVAGRKRYRDEEEEENNEEGADEVEDDMLAEYDENMDEDGDDDDEDEREDSDDDEYTETPKRKRVKLSPTSQVPEVRLIPVPRERVSPPRVSRLAPAAPGGHHPSTRSRSSSSPSTSTSSSSKRPAPVLVVPTTPLNDPILTQDIPTPRQRSTAVLPPHGSIAGSEKTTSLGNMDMHPARKSSPKFKASKGRSRSASGSTKGNNAIEGNANYAFISLHGDAAPKRARRKPDEITRNYACNYEGCTKAYGTLNHLNAHISMQSHGSKRAPAEFKELRKQWKLKRNGIEATSTNEEFATPAGGEDSIPATPTA